MKPIAVAVCIALALSACRGDETVSGYGAADRVWVLESVDGMPFAARAELEFPEQGKIAGQAPCNRFFADQSAPYPWFKPGPIGATRMACPSWRQNRCFLTHWGR